MLMKRKEKKINKMINNSLWDLPSPSTMTYFWNFGSMLGICLITQILTGLFLTFHYVSSAEESFESVVKIMREIWSGWSIRYIHMNGASMFFLFIYLHLFRGIYYLSSVHKKVWMTGMTILILIMSISFLGYVLPWGQMSYWAVAVITNLFSITPILGENLVQWIWGGFSVGSPTLNRFYTLHFLMPFILTFMILIHLATLHEQGSSNSMGLSSNLDKITFHPFFTLKDLIFIMMSLTLLIMISFFNPFITGDSINNIPANPMQTPIHIQPEWYFLTSYAILRALPSKTAGVMALIMSISIYFFIPMFKLNFSPKFSNYRKLMFYSMIVLFIMLMKMGSLPAEEPFISMSKTTSFLYFFSVISLNL